MKELSIGDIDIIGGKIVRCIENGHCTECSLDDIDCLNVHCMSMSRTGNQNVSFREVSLSSLTAEREQICKACNETIGSCEPFPGCANTADIDRQTAKVKELMK